MNIFILDLDPAVSVQYYTDAHINKMICETCQMLCTVHHMSGTPANNIPYKKSHKGHPCNVWARTNTANYEYLLKLGYLIENERRFRGFNPSSKMKAVLDWCCNNIPNIPVSSEMTSFAQSMPDKYRHTDTVSAFRAYYIGDKQGYWLTSVNKRRHTKTRKWKQSTWTKRGMPEWFVRDGIERLTTVESTLAF